MDYIHSDVALRLCAEIRREHEGKWYTREGFQCRTCWALAKSQLGHLRINDAQGYRGCQLVNARYDRLKGSPQQAA